MIALSLLLTGPRRLAWIEDDLPLPGPDQVLVRTVAGAVSVGTELPLYRGGARLAAPPRYPAMTGYESLARVVACGPGVETVAPGDRVFSFYGHRTHAVLRADRAVPVPPDVTDKVALLAILACDVAKGIGKVGLRPGEPALIAGAGTIGLLAVFQLAALGHAADVVEPIAARRDLALRLGARGAVAPDARARGDERYPVGFECSSRNAAFARLQQHMAPGGRICILSDGNLEPLELSPAFHARELLVAGSSDGLDYRGHAAWFYGQARSNSAALEAIYEAEVRAEDLPRLFESMADAAQPPLKVLVRYSD